MANNETNIKILAALNGIGRRVFDSLTGIQSGTYTAKELANANQYKSNPRGVKYELEDGYILESISVDNFNLEFERRNIFDMINKCHSLPGIPKSVKISFVKSETTTEDVFFATFTRSHKKLAKLVATTKQAKINESLLSVCLNPSKSQIVATDTRGMAIMHIDIDNNGLDLSDKQFTIDPKVLTQLDGRCKITADPGRYTITTETGEVFICESMRYPGYLRVIPDIAPDGHITLTEVSTKQLKAFAKRATKEDDSECVVLSFAVSAGSNIATATHVATNTTITLELTEPAQCSFKIGISAIYFVKYASIFDGSMWVTGRAKAIILDCADTICGLLLPATIDDAVDPDFDHNELIPALERYSASKSEPMPMVATIIEPEPEPETTNNAIIVAFCEWIATAIAVVSNAVASMFDELKTKIAELKQLAASLGVSADDLASLILDDQGARSEPAVGDKTSLEPTEPTEITQPTNETTEINVINVSDDVLQPSEQIVHTDSQNATDGIICGKFGNCACVGGISVYVASDIAFMAGYWRSYRDRANRIRDGPTIFVLKNL